MPVPRRLVPDLATDALDLLLGHACLRCGSLGRVLCDDCLEGLRGHAGLLTMPGLPVVAGALPYDGAARQLILAYKEHGTRALAPMLGVLLADAVRTALTTTGARRALLVPVPQHRRAARGFDALGAVAAGAERALVERGGPVRIVRLLRTAGEHRPLKTLGRAERERAVDGAFRVDLRAAGRAWRMPVMVVDDVMTTGATAREAIRALTDAGVPVLGVAAVAAASRDTWATIRGPAPTTSRP